MINKLSTDTDMYFDLLADPSKLRPLENNIDLKNDINSDDANLIDQANINNISEPEFQDNFSDKSEKSEKQQTHNFNAFSEKKPNINISRPKFSDSSSDKSSVKSPKPYTKKYSKSKMTNNTTESIPKPNVYQQIFGNLLEEYDNLPEKGKRLKRMEVFSRLLHLQSTYNIKLSRSYTIDSDYHEMVAELKFHNDIRNKINNVGMAKNILFNVIGCLELANSKYDPFGFNLEGWSEHLKSTNEETLTDILGELYEKYKSTGSIISPEVRLLLVLCGSAAQYHLIQSSGMKEIVNQNPELAKGINNMFVKPFVGEPKVSDSELEKKIKHDLYQEMKKRQNLSNPVTNPTPYNNFGSTFGSSFDDNARDEYLSNQQKILENQLKNRNHGNSSSDIEVSSVRHSINNRITETINTNSESTNGSEFKIKGKKTKSRSKIKIET